VVSQDLLKGYGNPVKRPQISPLRCAPVPRHAGAGEMTILCDAETPRFHERSAELQIPRRPRDDKGKGNGSTESGCRTEAFFITLRDPRAHDSSDPDDKQDCHLDRTRISCHAALDMAACAAFVKESSMKSANATKFHRKSGGAQRSGEIWGLFRFSRIPFSPHQSQPCALRTAPSDRWAPVRFPSAFCWML
jgi:hypothetical protein